MGACIVPLALFFRNLACAAYFRAGKEFNFHACGLNFHERIGNRQEYKPLIYRYMERKDYLSQKNI
jgi:hypothetical protein